MCHGRLTLRRFDFYYDRTYKWWVNCGHNWFEERSCSCPVSRLLRRPFFKNLGVFEWTPVIEIWYQFWPCIRDFGYWSRRKRKSKRTSGVLRRYKKMSRTGLNTDGMPWGGTGATALGLKKFPKVLPTVTPTLHQLLDNSCKITPNSTPKMFLVFFFFFFF